MIARLIDGGALAGLTTTLSAAGLPVSDLAEPHRRLLRFDDAAGLVGYGGIEGVGADRLLRSLVVSPARQGRGLGAAMLTIVERAAATDGTVDLYCLTTTAEPFFRRHGYAPVARADAPAGIAATAEFQSLCPASAAFLSKRIAS